MQEKIQNNIDSVEKLIKRLTDAGIDVSKYGVGKAKTIGHLLKEIQEGEIDLVSDEEGKLLRKVRIGTVEIFYTAKNGEKFKLKEEKQIFADGRVRNRDDFNCSVAGKMKKGEDPKEAVVREIREELGIEDVFEIRENGTEIKKKESMSYPGLISEYVKYDFIADMNEKNYRPEGYTEKTDSLTTHFVWEKIKS